MVLGGKKKEGEKKPAKGKIPKLSSYSINKWGGGEERKLSNRRGERRKRARKKQCFKKGGGKRPLENAPKKRG